jgi:hypothetical protein
MTNAVFKQYMMGSDYVVEKYFEHDGKKQGVFSRWICKDGVGLPEASMFEQGEYLNDMRTGWWVCVNFRSGSVALDRFAEDILVDSHVSTQSHILGCEITGTQPMSCSHENTA